jgi:hypothetical protein
MAVMPARGNEKPYFGCGLGFAAPGKILLFPLLSQKNFKNIFQNA